MNAQIRTFDTGATRDTDANKPDFEGFLSPSVIERYGQYMNKNRLQKDGSIRDSDNWQKGIPLSAYMKSGFRHFIDWWRGHRSEEDVEEALCALIFNASGYLHEVLKASDFYAVGARVVVSDGVFKNRTGFIQSVDRSDPALTYLVNLGEDEPGWFGEDYLEPLE